MSEPVSNAEIEDVLSSIRKLVSENTGGNSRASAGGASIEKFVLTPALRVLDASEEGAEASPDDAGINAFSNRLPDDQAGADPVVDQAESPEESLQAGNEVPGVKLEDRIAELEMAVGRSHEEWEPDGSEPDIHTPDGVLFEGTNAADLADVAQDWPDLSGLELVANDMEQAQDAVEEAEVQIEVEDDAQASPFAEITGLDTTEEPPVEVLETISRLDRLASGFREDAPQPAAAEADVEVEVEVNIDAMADQAAPAGQSASHLNEPPAGAYNENVQSLYADAAEDDEILDEDMLRELVTRLVREELQGSVGERITRNVRRLVRREIQRAMSLKDFE